QGMVQLPAQSKQSKREDPSGQGISVVFQAVLSAPEGNSFYGFSENGVVLFQLSKDNTTRSQFISNEALYLPSITFDGKRIAGLSWGQAVALIREDGSAVRQVDLNWAHGAPVFGFSITGDSVYATGSMDDSVRISTNNGNPLGGIKVRN